MKRKLKISILAGLSLVLMLGGCGGRGQMGVTEEPGLTQDMGEAGTEQEQSGDSSIKTLGNGDDSGEKQEGADQQSGEDWEEKNGYYYNLEGRESEFVDYFLGAGAYEQEPYFSYVNPEGEVQVELWHDVESGHWCGIRYAVTESEGSGQFPYGFVIESEEENKVVGGLESIEELSGEVVLALNSDDSYVNNIKNIKEHIEQDDSGRLLSYEVTGDYTFYDYEKDEDVVRESEYLYSIDYIYYDNGMTEKSYSHNILYFGSCGHFNRIVYDEQDREIYSRYFWTTYLSVETYYLYERGSDIPYGYLIIDEGTQGVPARIAFAGLEEDYLLEAIETQVILAEDTEIERYEWVDEEKTCFRIRVRYQEPPEQSYQHKEDYFFFLSDGTVTQVLYVDYPSKAEIYHDGLPDRYPMFACDFDAHLEDVTFDGNADLIISLGDSRWNSGSCAYVYENGVYRYEPTFEDISDYETDAEQKNIRGYARSGAAFYTNSIYEYRDGEFVEREHHHYRQYYDDNGDLQEMEVD